MDSNLTRWSKQFDTCHYLELCESNVQARVATLMLLNSVCTLFSDALFDGLKAFPFALKISINMKMSTKYQCNHADA